MFTFLAIAAALTMVQGVMQYQQAQAAGDAARDAGKYQNLLAQREAASAEQEAGQERARSQQAAILQRRRGELVQSRSRAFEAASGALDEGGFTEGGLIADTDYNVLSALYQGEEAGRGLEDRATIIRATGAGQQYAGKVQQKTLKHQGLTSLIGAGGSAAGIMAGGYAPAAGASTAGGGGFASNTTVGSPLYRNYGYGSPRWARPGALGGYG
jgi:hypothetical protein